jgi:hypothetical protein
MHAFARRFRRGAAVAVFVAGVALAAIVALGVVLIAGGDRAGGLAALGVAVVFVAAAAVLVVMSHPRSRALRQVAALNPDGAVFLGRRQPSLVSDLATYVSDAGVYDQVSDRWVVASIDGRGMSAWSVEPTSRELVLMPWEVVAAIEPIQLENGQPGVAVDVRPFPTPLVVSVGYAAFGILGSFGSRGVAEIVATANALRPTPAVE